MLRKVYFIVMNAKNKESLRDESRKSKHGDEQ